MGLWRQIRTDINNRKKQQIKFNWEKSVVYFRNMYIRIWIIISKLCAQLLCYILPFFQRCNFVRAAIFCIKLCANVSGDRLAMDQLAICIFFWHPFTPGISSRCSHLLSLDAGCLPASVASIFPKAKRKKPKKVNTISGLIRLIGLHFGNPPQRQQSICQIVYTKGGCNVYGRPVTLWSLHINIYSVLESPHKQRNHKNPGFMLRRARFPASLVLQSALFSFL